MSIEQNIWLKKVAERHIWIWILYESICSGEDKCIWDVTSTFEPIMEKLSFIRMSIFDHWSTALSITMRTIENVFIWSAELFIRMRMRMSTFDQLHFYQQQNALPCITTNTLHLITSPSRVLHRLLYTDILLNLAAAWIWPKTSFYLYKRDNCWFQSKEAIFAQ